MAFMMTKSCPHCNTGIFVTLTIEKRIGSTTYKIFFEKHETGPENDGSEKRDDWPHAIAMLGEPV